jgi:alanine dehydrogenase
VLVLGESEIMSVLDRDELIESVGRSLAELTTGTASMPPRIAATVPDRSALLLAMPGHLPGEQVLGAKLVSVFPGNASIEKPTHHAVIVLFDQETGEPEALLDGTALTAERTAAVSALATRLLARPESEVIAVLGTGVQARAHALTVARVCPAAREVRIAGRNHAGAIALVNLIASQSTVPVRVFPDFEGASSGADVVCAATHSPDPVVRLEWLSRGAHVNSVGFNVEGREVDAPTVASALVAVESRASALAPSPSGANDLLWPIRDGVIEPEHISVELGELFLGVHPGRTSPDQLTLFKSVGVAVEDLGAASLVVKAARARGVGRFIGL